MKHPRTPSRRSRKAALFAAVAAVGLTLAACSGQSPAPTADPGTDPDAEPIKVVINYERNAPGLPFVVGVEEGIFADHGLDVELFDGGPASTAISLLVNGQVNIVMTALPVGVLAAAEGLPIQVSAVGSVEVDGNPQYATIVGADSGISSYADLSGKTVAIHSSACCWEGFTREAVARDGGDPDSVSFVQVPFANQIQALREGQADAATTTQPFITLGEESGAAEFLGQTSLLAQGVDESAGTMYFTATSFIEQNPGFLEAWQTALDEVNAHIEANPEESLALVARETGLDAAVVEVMPLPYFTTTMSTELYDRTVGYLVEFGALEEGAAPTAEEFLAPGVIE